MKLKPVALQAAAFFIFLLLQPVSIVALTPVSLKSVFMIVTIDGPAGSGKSSTAKAVAAELGWLYLDSGALYRTYTLLYLMGGNDAALLKQHLDAHKVTIHTEGRDTEPLLNGERVGDEIRTTAVSEQVSTVAALPEVRDKVNEEMRRVVKTRNFIADGRDLGSVVFPDAELKFFMQADLDERARRRAKELQEKKLPADLEAIKKNLKQRDEQDSARKTAPLLKPDDAIEIDTTGLGFSEQVQQICDAIRAELKLS